ncbi:UNVERIFIED_CONTAM: hypothetical protein Sindi_0905300 [Sesamum indicum]
MLLEETIEHASIVGGLFGPPQRGYDPHFNMYNPGMTDYSSLSYVSQSQNCTPPPPPNPTPDPSLEDIVKALVTNTQQFQQQTQQFQQQFQQQTQKSIKKLESQISQLVSSVSKLESQGKLPSQSVINPKQNAGVFVFRSEKELQPNMDENDTKHAHVQQGEPDQKMEISQKQTSKPKTTDSEHHKVLMVKPPLSEGFAEQEEGEKKEILEAVSKVVVNIPLIDTIKRVPHYAKFLKVFGLRTYKIKSFHDKISSGKNSLINLKVFLGPHHLWVH